MLRDAHAASVGGLGAPSHPVEASCFSLAFARSVETIFGFFLAIATGTLRSGAPQAWQA